MSNFVPLSEFRTKQLERVLVDTMGKYTGHPMTPELIRELKSVAARAMFDLEVRTRPAHERLHPAGYRVVVERAFKIMAARFPEFAP